MPALVTTTSVVSGLVSLELLKIIQVAKGRINNSNNRKEEELIITTIKRNKMIDSLNETEGQAHRGFQERIHQSCTSLVCIFRARETSFRQGQITAVKLITVSWC